jgi:hypothetical protein
MIKESYGPAKAAPLQNHPKLSFSANREAAAVVGGKKLPQRLKPLVKESFRSG